MKKVQIIGAGISGLLCAYFAAEKGYEVEVCETALEPGGKIQTRVGMHGLMETAANATLADQLVEEVAAKIGLKLMAKKAEARKRYIYTLGQFTRWPLSFSDSLRFARFLFLWKMGSSSVQPQSHETLKVWSDRVLNANITECLLGPACQGIFGVDAQPLSASLIFNYFFSQRTKSYGRLRGSVAPEKGMGQWIELLLQYLKTKNVKFVLGQTSPIASDKVVIVATDLKNAVKILKENKDPRGEILAKVPYLDLVSVNVFYLKRPPTQKLGFGVLFSRSENIEPLGVLFNNDIFKNRSEGKHSETWIFGSQQKEYSQRPDYAFLEYIQATRHKLWNESSQPIEFRVNRWPEAIPLYGLELEKALLQLSLHPSSAKLHLMGNYLGEIGLNRLFHRAKSLLEVI